MGMLDFLRGLGGAVIGKSNAGSSPPPIKPKVEYSGWKGDEQKAQYKQQMSEYHKSRKAANPSLSKSLLKGTERTQKWGKTFTKSIDTGQLPYVGGITKGSATVYNPRTGKMEKTGGTKYMVAGISYAATRSKGVSVKSPGRPRLSFKPRPDPVTGRLIRVPANIYYKRARYAKRINSASYQRKQLQKAQFYQRRGIPPQQAAQIEMVRQQRAAQQLAQVPQQVPQQQMQMPQRQMPQQRYMPPQRYIPQQMRTDTNFFTGGVSTLPKERWLN